METIISKLIELCISAASTIILASIVFGVGRFIVKKLLRNIGKSRTVHEMDPTVGSFFMNFMKIGLNGILAITIVSILGVPMASVIAVLAAAGIAVGSAMKGSLGNLAGGIMLLIFRPFKVGDYIVVAGVEGNVRAITLFYTELIKPDKGKISIPNGSMMNSNITNNSSEPLRRVDLVFTCARGENAAKIRQLMTDVVNQNSQVLKNPESSVQIEKCTNESLEFKVKAWTSTDIYWDVYYDLTQRIVEAMDASGVQAPIVRITTENKLTNTGMTAE